MKYLILIATAILSTSIVFSQYETEWILTNGSLEPESTSDAILTNDGGVLLVGSFQGSINFGGNTVDPTGNQSFFIKKLDTDGSVKWTKVFKSDDRLFITKVVQDENSNFFLSGNFEGDVDFDPGTGVVNKASLGSPSAFILKLNSSGNFLWVKTIQGVDDINYRSLGVLNGKLMASGTFKGEADLDPSEATQTYSASTRNSSSFFVQEYDTSGVLKWTNIWSAKSRFINGSSSVQSTELHLDQEGNVYLVGTYTDSLDLDPGIGENLNVAVGGSNGFIIALDATNNYSWGKVLTGTGISSIRDLTVDDMGSIFLTGFFKDVVDFDLGDGDQSLTSNGQYDIFLLKLDDAGDFSWVKTYGGTSFDTGRSVKVDSDGQVYLAGEFQQTVSFNNSEETTFNATFYDGFILKLTSSGDYLSVNTIEGTSASYVTHVLPLSNNQYYAVGRFLDTAYFDNAKNDFKISEGSSDYFIAKYKDNSLVGIVDLVDQNKDYFSVTWNKSALKVSSLSGIEVQRISVYSTSGRLVFDDKEINLLDYEQLLKVHQGIYFVRILASNGIVYSSKVFNNK